MNQAASQITFQKRDNNRLANMQQGQTELAEVTIIGAGWFGLASARTYLELNPKSKVILIEASSSLGGVWARHRLASGLKSNNLRGTYEFSDFPMDEATFGVKKGEYIPGRVIHDYLTAFAMKFEVFDLIRFDSKAETVEKTSDGKWRISVKSETGTYVILTDRLIVATGLNSEAYVPPFEGESEFKCPLFHVKDFLQYESTVDPKKTLRAGTKSGWDAVYAYASVGIKVDWIIRESGHGPVWMTPSYVTPFKLWIEKLVCTRFLTWFSPCSWGDSDGFGRVRNFLHSNWIGRKIVDGFWWVLTNDLVTLNGYDKHPETKKLKPWIQDGFWAGTALSILNYPTDFFEFVRNGTITVHIADVSKLSERQVHLSNGSVLKVDLLACSTGWSKKPSIKFLPEGIDKDLGIPMRSDSEDKEALAKVDKTIFERFPKLKNQPNPNPKLKPISANEPMTCNEKPYRLYRFMVPPAFLNDRSIAFAGMISILLTAMTAQTQALWIAAYFGGLPLGKFTEEQRKQRGMVTFEEEARSDALLHSRFGRWRFPVGYGKINPDCVMDSIPYLDQLLQDLNINHHRKSGILAEIFQPYGAEDFKGLIQEWKSANTPNH